MRRIQTKKALPKVIQTTKPSVGLIKHILDEEVFDCLKSSIIKNSTDRLGTTIEAIERKQKAKSQRLARREKIRQQLVDEYGADLFSRFTNKRKRKEFAKGRLSSEQVGVLRYYTNQFREKARAKRRRAERRKAGTRTTYENYMASRAWAERRNRYWRSHPRRCAACNTPQFIHLHHMSYRKLGSEPDHHLIALCRTHHARYHDTHGTQRDMIHTTLAFVAKERQALIH